MSGFFQGVVHNFGLKLVSVLLAIGLWVMVASDPPAEVEINVPIEFHNLAENLEIDSATFTQAQIRVRGPERVIHQLRPTEVHAEIELSGMKPGSRTFDLTAQQVKLPQELEVVQIVPSQFQLSFDIRVTRTVKVHPRVTGVPENAQRFADPPNIVIAGPKRRVENVDEALTDPVDATGTMTRATFVTQAYVPDPLIQVVHPAPIRVTVIMEQAGK